MATGQVNVIAATVSTNEQHLGMKISILLLDSEASQHMTGRLNFLSDIYSIQPCFISFFQMDQPLLQILKEL